MQCNYNSFIQIINFHGIFRNALRCRKTGACRVLVPLRYGKSGHLYSFTSLKHLMMFWIFFSFFRALFFYAISDTDSSVTIVNGSYIWKWSLKYLKVIWSIGNAGSSPYSKNKWKVFRKLLTIKC